MDVLQDEVDAVRQNTVSAESRRLYARSIARFLLWLIQNKPDLVTENLLTAVDTSTGREALEKIKAFVEDKDNGPPIDFESITARVFVTWLVSIRKSNGAKPGYSAYNSHRAALFNLYRDYDVSMSSTLKEQMSHFFKGLKRTTARRTADGMERVQVGKNPLQFVTYRRIGQFMLDQHHSRFDSIFGHFFMVLCWNLMCRAGQCSTICISHLEWINDSLGVYFAQQKNDQTGERPRDPRHIYANPIMPEVCPILSLGVYLLCYPSVLSGVRLFPGDNQYERFRSCFHKVCCDSAMDMNAEDIGTHSIRKGACTYASSGTTACPSATAVHLRAGWTLGGVQDTYLRYDGAGDMHVGRTVCGLPTDRPEFAMLPPHFVGVSEDALSEALGLCFRTGERRQMLEFALASVIYHKEFILRTFPPQHRLFSTALFTEGTTLESLRPFVKCAINESGGLCATGIPPHTMILTQMHDLASSVCQILPAIRQCSEDTISGVVGELESRAIGAGTVTRDGLNDSIMRCLEVAGIPQIMQRLESLQVSESSGANTAVEESNDNDASSATSNNHSGIYVWGGRLHKFPEDVELPNGGVLEAWQWWIAGNVTKGYRPLRELEPIDCSTRNKKKRLCDYRYLMTGLEERAKEGNFWIDEKTISAANEMFECLATVLDTLLQRQRIAQLKTKKLINWLYPWRRLQKRRINSFIRLYRTS